MTSLHEQQADEKRPTTIGMAWNRIWEMVRPIRQVNSKVGKNNKQGRSNVHEIVTYMKTCGMDPENVELRRSILGGVHVTFNFDDDDTIESSESSNSLSSQDHPVLQSSNKKGQERSTRMKRQKVQPLIGIDIQDPLLREWAK
jgi:hypothetical protein